MRSGLQATEREFQSTVVEMAALFGWIFFHTHDSRHSAPGFPDLVLVRPPRVIVAELKTETGKTSPSQRLWLDNFRACAGVETHLWRPSDLDEIAGVLR